MLLRRPRCFDPQDAAGVNWGHSRADGLVFFAPLSVSHGLRDLVSGNTFTRTGLNSGVSVGQVQSRRFGASNYADFTPPTAIGPTTPFSVAWTQVAIATSGSSTILHCNFGTAGVHNPFAIYQATTGDYIFTAGPNKGTTAVRWGVATGALTNWRVDRFALLAKGGSQSGAQSDYSLFRNGVLLTASAPTVFTTVTTGGARIGALLSGSDPWEGGIADLRMWARVLTEQEAADESRIELAPELYEFRRIWVPASAGAPSLPTLSALTVKPGTLTSTGFTARVTAS